VTYDASNPEQIAEARNRARQQAQLEANMIRALMDLEQGRLWMWNLLAACHVFSTSFAKNSLEMAFAEGERNVGLRLLAAINTACPDLYIKMVQEQGEKK